MYCTYVPQLCSWCHLVASDTGRYTTARYSTVPFAYWYCSARTILLVFFHRDVFYSLCSDHVLDFRKMENEHQSEHHTTQSYEYNCRPVPPLSSFHICLWGERSRRYNSTASSSSLDPIYLPRSAWPLAVLSQPPLSTYQPPNPSTASTCILPGLGAVREATSIELPVYISLNFRRSRVSKKANTPSSATSKEFFQKTGQRTRCALVSGTSSSYC